VDEDEDAVLLDVAGVESGDDKRLSLNEPSPDTTSFIFSLRNTFINGS
jgi:hypothetical protein